MFRPPVSFRDFSFPFEENRTRPSRILLTCALVCVPKCAANAQFQVPTFLTRTNDPAPIGARRGFSAYFNGDGWLDVATANTGPNTVAVHFEWRTRRRVSRAA